MRAATAATISALDRKYGDRRGDIANVAIATTIHAKGELGCPVSVFCPEATNQDCGHKEGTAARLRSIDFCELRRPRQSAALLFNPTRAPTGDCFNQIMMNFEMQGDREFSSLVLRGSQEIPAPRAAGGLPAGISSRQTCRTFCPASLSIIAQNS